MHTDEVFFRDTAHGSLAWALGVVVSAAIVALAGASILGGAGAAATSVASSAAQGVAQGATTAAGPLAYFTDALFRPGTAAPASGAAGSQAAPPAAAATTPIPAEPSTARSAQDTRAEAGRILVQSMAAGSLAAPDRTYLAQVISAQTGLSQADAEKRVDDVMGQVTAATDKAKQAADQARKAAATLALFSFVSLLIGAFIASAAAAYGGRLRDENELTYRTAR